MRVVRFVQAQGVGVAINPMAVEGQIDGGAVQGIGCTISEEVVIQDGKMLNPSLTTYLMPMATDVPSVENSLVQVPMDDGPFGAYAGRLLVYCGRIDHRNIVVIWRETEGWQKAALARDKKFAAEQQRTEGANAVFINGDALLPGARALEPVCKARMLVPVEA